jgi:hypothetical protein
VSPWKAISLENAVMEGIATMEDPGITRLDIDRYQRSLKLNLSDAARQETLALLAAAQARLENGNQDNQPKAEQQ